MRIYKTGYVLSREKEGRTVHRNFTRKSEPVLKAKTLEDVRCSGAPYYKYIASSSDTCASCAALHVIDRIARILFHETSDSRGQEAIDWLMLNRLLKDGAQYTTNWNDELTLFNIVTAREQYEIFQEQHNQSSKQPSAYALVEWIAGIENTTVKKEQEQSLKNSLSLAKLLVSATCNPDLDTPDKIRGVFESWVSNPFNCENPYNVWEYRSYPVNDAAWRQNIGGNIFYQK